MSLTPNGRALLLALTAVLLGLVIWAVSDGPVVADPSDFEPREPAVQCRSVAAGPGPASPVPDDQQMADATVALTLSGDDVVHEDEVDLGPAELELYVNRYDAQEPFEVGEQVDAVAALDEKARRCDAARTRNVLLAGASGLPALGLFCCAVLARHRDRSSKPYVPMRRRFEVTDD